VENFFLEKSLDNLTLGICIEYNEFIFLLRNFWNIYFCY